MRKGPCSKELCSLPLQSSPGAGDLDERPEEGKTRKERKRKLPMFHPLEAGWIDGASWLQKGPSRMAAVSRMGSGGPSPQLQGRGTAHGEGRGSHAASYPLPGDPHSASGDLQSLPLGPRLCPTGPR